MNGNYIHNLEWVAWKIYLHTSAFQQMVTMLCNHLTCMYMYITMVTKGRWLNQVNYYSIYITASPTTRLCADLSSIAICITFLPRSTDTHVSELMGRN